MNKRNQSQEFKVTLTSKNQCNIPCQENKGQYPHNHLNRLTKKKFGKIHIFFHNTNILSRRELPQCDKEHL